MIEDANLVPRGSQLQIDVCVVGGGAAGISLALSLSGSGMKVLLLESGRVGGDTRAQALYEGEVADERLHSPPHRYRQRGLGGSTRIWGGRCMPFDPIDFEQRAHVSHSGWPIGYEDLHPYYVRANAWAEAGRYAYDARDALPTAPPLIAGFSSDVAHTHGLERFSCPTDFGKRYEKRLAVARDVRVLRGANCTAVRLSRDGQQVVSLDIATLLGNRFHVVPKATVLAAGGLETARLLLCSNDVAPQGVGNEHDVVGRYYMCHIAGNVGTLTIRGAPTRVRHGYEIAPDGVYCRRRITIAPAEQRRHNLLNAVARLHFAKITDPAHQSGVLSGLYLARSLISYEYAKRLHDRKPSSADTLAQHLVNVVTDPLDTAAFLSHWLRHRTLAHRKFPSVILRNRANRFSLEVQSEQTPLPSSRVLLTEGSDSLGMRRLRVDWRYCQADIESVGRTLDLIAAELARAGTGRFEYDAETLEEELLRYGAYGGHHVGTARMGSDVRTSVIDANCKVHSVSNLYVAGSAAFPTTSQANPTLTLIALSLRLADRLRQRLVPRRAPAVELRENLEALA